MYTTSGQDGLNSVRVPSTEGAMPRHHTGPKAGKSPWISDSAAEQLGQSCGTCLKVPSVTFQDAIFPVFKGSKQVRKHFFLFFKI